MSELIRIKPVSSKSKLETLREFGHRSFIEVGEGDKPLGFFVETKETAGISVSKPTPGRRTPVAGHQALVWTNKPLEYRENSNVFKIAQIVKEFARVPTRRDELVKETSSEVKNAFTNLQVSNTISMLVTDGYLVIPG